MHDKGRCLLSRHRLGSILYTETGRERKRDGYRMLGRRMEKSKRSNLPVERGMSKKFFLGIYGVHTLEARERERES